jgi:hypothetical protein
VARQERLWVGRDEAPNMKTGKEKKKGSSSEKETTRESNPSPEDHDWQILRSDGTSIGVKVNVCNALMQ